MSPDGAPPADPDWLPSTQRAWDLYWRDPRAQDLISHSGPGLLLLEPLFDLYDEVKRLRKVLSIEDGIRWGHRMREYEAACLVTAELRRSLGLPDPPDREG